MEGGGHEDNVRDEGDIVVDEGLVGGGHEDNVGDEGVGGLHGVLAGGEVGEYYGSDVGDQEVAVGDEAVFGEGDESEDDDIEASGGDRPADLEDKEDLGPWFDPEVPGPLKVLCGLGSGGT